MRTSVSQKDWEDFRATGRVPIGARSEIVESWRRSLTSKAHDLSRAPRLEDSALDELQRRSARLLGVAVPAIRKAGHLLSRSGRMILISDADGTVLDLTGDRATVEKGLEDHLHIGGRWREDDIGTNAIGTALRTNRPVQVFSSEHYCPAIQRWSCSATPLIDPVNGQTLGVVDVSWPADMLREDFDALSVTLGLQIESLLRQKNILERERLNEIAFLRRMRRGQAAMALFDRYGHPVQTIDGARLLADDDVRLLQLREVLPDLIHRQQAEIEAWLARLSPDLSAELITDRGESIGLLLSRRIILPNRAQAGYRLEDFRKAGPVMAQIATQAARLARTCLPVLIEGETGTGKTSLAKAIHEEAGRKPSGIHKIDCAVLTADHLRQSLAEGLPERMAEQSDTLFLEGPSSCPQDAQKLLLTLVEQAIDLGVALVSVSTRNLADEVEAGRFRRDLYYRIAVARLATVPLRERRDEIAAHLRQIAVDRARGGAPLVFSVPALKMIEAYHWPGNLREMTNLVDMLLATSSSRMIDHRSLPPEFYRKSVAAAETLRDGERMQILDAIDQSEGNLSQAARRLGIARSTLYLKMESYRLSERRKA